MIRLVVLGGALMLVGGACTNGDSASTSTTLAAPGTEVTTTDPPTTTTTAASTTSTTGVATTSTATEATDDDNLIGTQVAYDELVDQVLSDVRVRSNTDLAAGDVPLPDLRVADPVDALGEILEFDAWVYRTYPVPPWAELWAQRGSPYWVDTARALDSLAVQRLKFAVTGEPWELISASDADETEIVGWDVTGLDLDGAIPVMFESSLGTYDRVGWESEEVNSSSPGWHVEGIAVLVPTDGGWRIHDMATRDL